MVIYGAENLLTGSPVPEHVWRLLAKELKIETVKQFGYLDTTNKSMLEIIEATQTWLKTISQLGKSTVEGVVLKRMKDQILTQDGVPMFAKVVSDSFREIKCPEKNPKPITDIIATLVALVDQDKIYMKAVEHLRDENKIEFKSSDIGILINEVKRDLLEDMATPAKELLWQWAKDQVTKGAVMGFAKWYQNYLIEKLKETPNECKSLVCVVPS